MFELPQEGQVMAGSYEVDFAKVTFSIVDTRLKVTFNSETKSQTGSEGKHLEVLWREEHAKILRSNVQAQVV